MAFKNPIDAANNINEENIYNDWQNKILTNERKSQEPIKMASSIKDSPLKKMDDSFKQMFLNAYKDNSANAQKVLDHLSKYEELADRYGLDIEDLANKYGGQMVGLEYRLKRPGSIYRKAMADMEEAKAKGGEELDFDSALKNIRDTARYTMVFNDDDFKNNVIQVMNEMKAKGYTPTKFKNTFLEGSPYKGLNAAFVDKDGNPFELQFHIPSSVRLKEGIDVDLPNKMVTLNKRNITSHDKYETTRDIEDKINKGIATEDEKNLLNVLNKKSTNEWSGVRNYDFDYKI